MKYCLNYNHPRLEPTLDTVDEIKIVYRKTDETLPAFLEKYQHKTIIISLEKPDQFIEEKDINLLKSLYEKYPCFKCTCDFENEWVRRRIAEANIPFFFENHVNTWDMLNGLLIFGVTDIYITDELAFNMHKVASVVHEYGAKVRIFPNVAQSSFSNLKDIMCFFVRPEDIQYYEDVVDVCELWPDESRNIEVVLKAYRDKKEWFGPLEEIITRFTGTLDGRHILSIFGSRRVNCQKRCMQGMGCRICMEIANLSDTAKEKNVVIRQKLEENLDI